MIKERLLFLFLLLVSIGMLVLSIYVSRHSFTVITTYEKTKGIIIDYDVTVKKNDDGRERTLYAPIYAYYDRQGKQYRVNSGARSIKKHESDVSATVYYNKEHPEIATASNFELYWVPFIAIFFTVVCSIITYVVRKPAVTR